MLSFLARSSWEKATLVGIFMKLHNAFCVVCLAVVACGRGEPGDLPPQNAAKGTDPGFCATPLELSLEAYLRAQVPGAHWGLRIEEVGSVRLNVSLNASDFFAPASNTKLLTTAAALAARGAGDRFATRFFWSGGESGVLRVRGSGDPTLTILELGRVAEALAEQKIESVDRIVVEEDSSHPLRVPADWSYSDLVYHWGQPLGLLNLEQNLAGITFSPGPLGGNATVTWQEPFADEQWSLQNGVRMVSSDEGEGDIYFERILPIGSSDLRLSGYMREGAEPFEAALPVREPALYFGHGLKKVLEERGISVGAVSLEDLSSPAPTEDLVYTHESRSLLEIITETNVPSNNLYAEALAARLANPNGPVPISGRHQAGVAAIPEILSQHFGVSPDFFISDGSGLSQYNLVTPNHFFTLLRNLFDSPLGESFRSTLPVGGKTGTLRRRFLGTPLEGFVHAKTGTLSSVSALSGYVMLPEKAPMVFSVILGGSRQKSSVRAATIDQLLILANRYRDCSL